VFRITSRPDQLGSDLAEFARLQRSRWGPTGLGISDQVVAVLREAGELLLGALRFRLWSVEVEGRIISSHLFLAAGGEVTYWLGAFDDAWASYGPGVQAVLVAIEHATVLEDRRIDLGPGDEPYKRRLSDHEEIVEWWDLVPSGFRVPRTFAQAVPWALREAVSTRLSPTTKDRLRHVLPRSARPERGLSSC
jgi:CelD/BcsL family acetyltransferase involved in cellulose biosynthesis